MMLDAEICKQNEGYFKIFDYIVNNLPETDRIRILDANGQLAPLLLEDNDTQVHECVNTVEKQSLF